MDKQKLKQKILEKQSYLCVGLDSSIDKLPTLIPKNMEGLFEFNKAIIEATKPYAVSYKINIAFYEVFGKAGWEVLEKTLEILPKDTFNIADAKRGDIGNTSKMYASAFLETMDFDAVTVAPYMGEDSVQPFLEIENKWVILLALTSNSGSKNFQHLYLKDFDEKLFERVLKTSKEWGSTENMMYVVGATQADALKDIRKIIPNHFLLVPGVGAQGGSLKEVSQAGITKDVGLLVNSSRGIIYASNSADFADAAAREAEKLQTEMAKYLAEAKLI